jgi:hypothetical protein
MVILAIALVSLFDAHTRGLRAADAADAYAEARILGEALLADVVTGWSSPLVPRSGRQGRYNWSIDVAPAGAAWAEFKSESWRLHHVRVTIAWDRDRSIALDTLKLGRVHE